MISIVEYCGKVNVPVSHIYCLEAERSTITDKVGDICIKNGSVLTVIDKGAKSYMFSESDSTWYPI